MIPRTQTLLVEAANGRSAHRLAYHIWKHNDENAPVLLCVHGLTRNGRDFDFLARRMAETHTVICPDMPGRGKSDWLDDTRAYNYDTYLHDIKMLIAELGITQLDWVGSSLGGILAMRMAAEQPGVIRNLVLNDIGAVIPIQGLKRINQYVGMTMQFAGREQAEEHIRAIYGSFGIDSDEHWKHLLDHSFTQLSNGMYQLAYDPGILDPLRDEAKTLTIAEDTLLWPWWDIIACPVLLLRGETSDILTESTANEMVTRKPASTSLVTFPGVGHAPSLMDEAQIDVIKNWLDGQYRSSIAEEPPIVVE